MSLLTSLYLRNPLQTKENPCVKILPQISPREDFFPVQILPGETSQGAVLRQDTGTDVHCMMKGGNGGMNTKHGEVESYIMITTHTRSRAGTE